MSRFDELAADPANKGKTVGELLDILVAERTGEPVTATATTQAPARQAQPSARQVEYNALFSANVAAGMPITKAKAVAKTTLALVHDELPTLTEDEFIALPSDLTRELTTLTKGSLEDVIADKPATEQVMGIDRDMTEEESAAIIAKHAETYASRADAQRAEQLANARQAAVNGLVAGGIPLDEAQRIAESIAEDTLLPEKAARSTQPELDALKAMPREAFGLASRED